MVRFLKFFSKFELNFGCFLFVDNLLNIYRVNSKEKKKKKSSFQKRIFFR
jgi:hypothetical protein